MNTSIESVERVLQTYSLEEIFEVNEVTEEEVLFFLLDKEFIKLPNPRPVDLL